MVDSGVHYIAAMRTIAHTAGRMVVAATTYAVTYVVACVYAMACALTYTVI